MRAVKDDFGFVSFDDLAQDEDEFGFVPFKPIQKGTPISQEPQSQPAEIEQSPPSQSQEPSFTQQFASSAPVQLGLGLTKALTFPLDLLKFAMTAEGLSGVDEVQEFYELVGKPFDRDKFIQEIQQAASYIPTQQMAEDFIKEKTGVNLEPQGPVGKIARGAGEFYALTPGEGIIRRGAGAVSGAATSEGLKNLGVPEIAADIVGAGTAGLTAGGKITPKAVAGEAKEAREIAEKHGLRKFAGLEREKPPRIYPVVSEAKEKALRTELTDTTQKAISDVIDQKLPIKRIRDRGMNLEDATEKAYSLTRKAAESIPGEINIAPVRKWAQQEIKRIKSASLSPSDAEKKALKILEDELEALSKGNPTATQLINQYQNFNSNVKSIYKKPEFSGAENEIKRVYAQLNDKLVESVKASKYPELAKMFQFSNKLYHETAKLSQVEGILSKAFKDGYNPKTLLKMLEGKRSRAYLDRYLGKDAVKDLMDIASYGQRAERKVFDYLKNPKTVGEYINKLTPLQLGLLLGKKTALVPYAIVKPALSRIQGHLFTRDATRKSYINLLKSTASPATLLKAAQGLEKAIKDEFGSEQEFINFLDSEEQ